VSVASRGFSAHRSRAPEQRQSDLSFADGDAETGAVGLPEKPGDAPYPGTRASSELGEQFWNATLSTLNKN
jgi:hypothetical protein